MENEIKEGVFESKEAPTSPASPVSAPKNVAPAAEPKTDFDAVKSPTVKLGKMEFPAAIKELIGGSKITREEWAGGEYCLLKDGYLEIWTNGKFHQWIVSDGDLSATDWLVK